MTLTSLVVVSGVFTVVLGLWHIGLPRWFAFRAAILGRGDRDRRDVGPLPPYRLGPIRYATKPADVLGIARVMNAATSYALVSIGVVCLAAPAWVGTPIGRVFALWLVGWWGIRAGMQLAVGRRRIDAVLMVAFGALTALFAIVAVGGEGGE